MEGYQRLSEYLGENPDLMIFQRFLSLNARNLLVMQAEIVRLEASLEMTMEDDNKSGDPKRAQYQYNIGLLKGPHDQPEAALQWKKTLEVRKLLKDYNKAVLQCAAVAQLAPVDKDDLACLREVLEKPCGSGQPFPQSIEYFTYDEKYEHDMTSLAGTQRDKDKLTRWINQWVRKVYHKHSGNKYHDPVSSAEAGTCYEEPLRIHTYSDSAITSTIDTISTILASTLPTLAAVAVYVIEDPMSRMGAIVGCTLLFSTILTLVARPKRAECFGISAAFAAVLVVFVGNSNWASSGSSC